MQFFNVSCQFRQVCGPPAPCRILTRFVELYPHVDTVRLWTLKLCHYNDDLPVWVNGWVGEWVSEWERERERERNSCIHMAICWGNLSTKIKNTHQWTQGFATLTTKQINRKDIARQSNLCIGGTQSTVRSSPRVVTTLVEERASQVTVMWWCWSLFSTMIIRQACLRDTSYSENPGNGCR